MCVGRLLLCKLPFFNMNINLCDLRYLYFVCLCLCYDLFVAALFEGNRFLNYQPNYATSTSPSGSRSAPSWRTFLSQ